MNKTASFGFILFRFQENEKHQKHQNATIFIYLDYINCLVRKASCAMILSTAKVNIKKLLWNPQKLGKRKKVKVVYRALTNIYQENGFKILIYLESASHLTAV